MWGVHHLTARKAKTITIKSENRMDAKEYFEKNYNEKFDNGKSAREAVIECMEEYVTQKCREQKEIDLKEIISPTTFPIGTQTVGRPFYKDATQMQLAEIINKAPLATDQ